MLEGVPAEFRRLVLGAVFLHNKRTLPADLPQDLLATVRILRDSDKLDIFPVLIAHFAKPEPDHPEVCHDVASHPTAYSPHVAQTLLRREMGDYAQIKWTNDFKLNAVGWVYDLNFRTSCEILQQSGYIETIFASLPADGLLTSLREQIFADLARRTRGA